MEGHSGGLVMGRWGGWGGTCSVWPSDVFNVVISRGQCRWFPACVESELSGPVMCLTLSSVGGQCRWFPACVKSELWPSDVFNVVISRGTVQVVSCMC